jgi:Ni/Co efflux regulator RcnB
MLSRLLAAAMMALPLLLAQAATAKEAWSAPTAKEAAKETGKEPSVAQSAARERQKKCGAEWRALSATEKAAQGPKWPQYYSKCVKRLKQQKA